MDRAEDIVNQTRFMILTIASDCIKNDNYFNLLPLLKLLKKSANGQLDDPVNEILVMEKLFLTKSTWFFLICQNLSLDKEEITALLKE
jgi:hypothetical protein